MEGSGYNLALTIRTPGVVVQDLAVVPAIGDLPLNFHTAPKSYSHLQIIDMVVFYNENFGIVLADGIRPRADKFQLFLENL